MSYTPTKFNKIKTIKFLNRLSGTIRVPNFLNHELKKSMSSLTVSFYEELGK